MTSATEAPSHDHQAHQDAAHKRGILNRSSFWIDRINGWLGRVGAALLLLSTALVFVVVVLRYAFNSGSVALQEAGVWLHASAFLLAAAWTLKHNGHVRVDVLYQRFTPKQRAWVELLGAVLFLLPICGFIIYSSWNYVGASWAVLESSAETGGLPGRFILKSMIPLAAASLALQALSQIFKALLQLRTSAA